MWIFYFAGISIGISGEIVDTVICKYLALSRDPRRSFALYRFIYGLTTILTMFVQYFCVADPWVFFWVYFGCITLGKFMAPRLNTVMSEGSEYILSQID